MAAFIISIETKIKLHWWLEICSEAKNLSKLSFFILNDPKVSHLDLL